MTDGFGLKRKPQEDADLVALDQARTVLANLRRVSELTNEPLSSRLIGLVIKEGYWDNNDAFHIRRCLARLRALARISDSEESNPLYALTENSQFEADGLSATISDERLLELIAQAKAPLEVESPKLRRNRASDAEFERPARHHRSFFNDSQED